MESMHIVRYGGKLVEQVALYFYPWEGLSLPKFLLILSLVATSMEI